MFNKGDKVVRTTFYGGYENGFMTKGGVYEVTGYDSEGFMLMVKGSQGLYNDEVFQLVEASDPQFKNMKGMFSNMKFRVNSPEHSKEIQEALFEMGYKWSSHGTNVMFTDGGDAWLCTEKTGIIYRTSQDWCNYQEHTAETTKSYKLIPVEIPKPETITIDGKTYDKEDVLKRLAELEGVK